MEEAQRKKQHAEDMAAALTVDAEHLRQTAEALVLEKAQMSDEYAKVGASAIT